MSIESPSYEVVKKTGSLELRRYDSYLVASVRVKAAGYNEAANAGFRALADYIFGNNTVASTIPMTAPVTTGRTRGEHIDMTVPVTSERERIEMTVPVTSERERHEQLQDAPALCTIRCPGEYTVNFSMPSRFRTLEDLPRPNDPRVELQLVEAHLAVVARFGGYLHDEDVAKAVAQIEAWIAEEGLVAAGEPQAAQYDAPWKPWFARHNEVLVPVAERG